MYSQSLVIKLFQSTVCHYNIMGNREISRFSSKYNIDWLVSNSIHGIDSEKTVFQIPLFENVLNRWTVIQFNDYHNLKRETYRRVCFSWSYCFMCFEINYLYQDMRISFSIKIIFLFGTYVLLIYVFKIDKSITVNNCW